MPTKKIVLSHDSALLAILENSFFQREGFEMVQVKDGQTGYEAVEMEAPTMAVFDLGRLGAQALTCCRSIKEDPLLSQTPVLLLLPDDAEGDLADQCWDAGCDAVVHRPLAAERFLDAACGLLGISRRLSRRFPVSFQLQFVDEKLDKHFGSCINLNAGGMFLATETLFPVDTTLTIEFTLPQLNVSLSRPVRVAWVNHPEWRKKNAMPCGMGLQFLEVTLEFRTILEDFIKRLSIEDL
jgi:DNA-binding response OmpR family regulator